MAGYKKGRDFSPRITDFGKLREQKIPRLEWNLGILQCFTSISVARPQCLITGVCSLVERKVEPERIELSSREDNTVLSTCLVDFRLSGAARQATA